MLQHGFAERPSLQVECADHRGLAGRSPRLAVGDPLRETAVQLLMPVHFALRNRVDAIGVYRTFARRLRDELGMDVQPLPETSRILVEGFWPDSGRRCDWDDELASLLGDG